jgi:glycosyltransferase involved in cell wall biosynthesis
MLVVPSQSYESFGLTIIEAMSLGIPIVATNVGGIPEVLEGSGAGFVSGRDDVSKFSDCMMRILNNPELRVSMRIAGQKEYLNRFTAERMAREYFDLMKR